MSKKTARRSRKARRKLRAHDQGQDRHNKGLAQIKKQQRLEQKKGQ